MAIRGVASSRAPGSVCSVSIGAIKAFLSLDTAEKKALAKKLVKVDFSGGDKVVCQSDDGKDVYFLISGQVRVCTFSREGKEIQFEDLYAGEMFGELAALDDGSRAGECISLNESTVAVMSQQDFLSAIDPYPGFNRYVLTRIAGMLRSQMERVIEFSSLTVKDRLRYELIRLAGRQGERVNGVIVIANPPTHSDIASRIGTHREAVTRELKRLQGLGLIQWSRREHTINDLHALQLSVEQIQSDMATP